MDNERDRRDDAAKDPNEERGQDERESGLPGGGRGRRDEVGQSRVYNIKDDNIPPDAEIRMAGSWGGGDYNESGGSELVFRDGTVLGGMTAGPDGEPTIDIHAGKGPPPAEEEDAVIGNGAEAVDRRELMLRGLPPSDETSRADAPRSQEGREQREPESRGQA
ncbi:MAG TPA: hypothetical protein VFS44_13795 [Gemmatimonadaceae bacterium]|nr:hypothetical protein [Gemmatimonadaceae bacterium]